jgi:hypothetical protein
MHTKLVLMEFYTEEFVPVIDSELRNHYDSLKDCLRP